MAIAQQFTDEKNLVTAINGVINTFWQSGTFSSFQGTDNIRINYALFINAQHTKSLVIVQGRSESYLKYQELAYEFYQQGYNLFLLDHRGQGLSERMLTNAHKGFVHNFNDYAKDLQVFISQHVLPSCGENTKPFLIAHSMGAAIASLYLAKHSEDIQAAVLSSPMFAINAGGMPKKLANLLINFASFTEHLCCKTGCYFPGQKNYYVKPFQHNKLSHSKLRYRLFKELFNQKSELQLGGVTIQWLKLAYKIKGKVWKLLPNISTPISVMQAGDDYIVDNQSQNEFCVKVNQLHPNSCPNGEPFTIADAWHELFFEQDVYREKAINHCLEWFDKHLQV